MSDLRRTRWREAGPKLLAWLPLIGYTELTRTDGQRLREEIVDVRACGYADGEGELEAT